MPIFVQLFALFCSEYMNTKGSDRREYQRDYREKNRGKRQRISISLTQEEYRQLEKQAGNLKLATFVKMLALSSLPGAQKPLDEEVVEALRAHTMEIRRIGNNLNQIARQSNSFVDIDRNAVFHHLRQMEDRVARFVRDQAES